VLNPFARGILLPLCLTLALPLLAIPGFAQEKPAPERGTEIAYPLVVINLASIERALGHVDFLFNMIDRPEISDLVGVQLANLRDLKGIDRTRPAGVMIFLSEGLAPLPVPVGYLPIEDIGQFGQTVEAIGAQFKSIPDADGWYELIPQRGPTQYIMLQNGYAFIGQNQDSIDRAFADPAVFGATLGSHYDLCLSANLRRTPKHVRELLLATLRTSTQASMQQRDDEPDGAYRIRKSQAEGNLHFFEGLLQHGDEATLGVKLDRDARHAALELVVRAVPDTAFAEEILEGAGQPSYFRAAVDENVPLSFSVSGMLSKYNRKSMAALFDVGQTELNRGLAGLPSDTQPEEIPQLESVRGLFDSLKSTMEAGHLDTVVQVFGEPPQKFVVAGGVKLVDADKFGTGLSDILTRAQQSSPEIRIELAVASHNDVVLHRMAGPRSERGNEQIFGGDLAFYVGADSRALWFAFGGEEAVPTLKAMIDRVATGQGDRRQPEQLKPFEFVMNMGHWVRQANPEAASAVEQEPQNPEGQRGRRRGPPMSLLARQAFETPGSDVLRMDATPIENGFRMRIQVENGFLRLLGLAIARGIDGSTRL